MYSTAVNLPGVKPANVAGKVGSHSGIVVLIISSNVAYSDSHTSSGPTQGTLQGQKTQ